MSSLPRTIKNIWKAGLRSTFEQLNSISDTKYGRLVGVDSFGNRYYENLDEMYARTRWVLLKNYYHDASQIEPGWYTWLRSITDDPPTVDKTLKRCQKPWQPADYLNPTLNFRKSLRTYSTVKPAYKAWEPKVLERK